MRRMVLASNTQYHWLMRCLMFQDLLHVEVSMAQLDRSLALSSATESLRH